FWAEGFVYINVDEKFRRRRAHSFPWDKPKVIVNGHIISRGPWRIVAYPDSAGLVCYQNFIGIWPKTDINIEVLSALVNSPLANAALFSKGGKRDNRIRALEQIPIPLTQMIDEKRITYLAKYYKALRSSLKEETVVGSNIQDCSQTLMEMDSLILKAYDLPPRLERKLLELFRGHPRPVPFDFPDYFPEDFRPCIPLHKYIEMDLKQASAGELLKRITPFDSEDMHEFFMDIEARQS
ncbi:MAG TPA: hypothetical protein VMW90_09670, partial [Acidobacteriota bacterium]|nr:hypothetical protein [Acidobacteriota bacterium]